ncbi:hypothetical protein PILCRDRAFT_180012 [Piloderma croceum F 1598]|uniref:RING-type domain-containing protein n=1 Tax=Piloderma croceum (strain F 1598) TaxID=765440 RepID=A0A0C3GI76_PILCF|nr:hypothetical protein PILCRDRAFT_180012 [Piloderma croceum F 1598]
MADCTICLDPLKSAVVIPCGHVYCEECLTSHIQTGDDANSSHCPSCRAKFNIVLPNLQYVPTKYHAYILPPIRKLYLSKPSSSPPAQIQAEAQITTLQAQIKSLSTSNAHLSQRCHLQKAALGTLADAARDTKAELVAAELEVENARTNAERVRVDVEKTRAEIGEVREALEDMTSRYTELKEMMVIRYVDRSLHRTSSTEFNSKLEPKYYPTLGFGSLSHSPSLTSQQTQFQAQTLPDPIPVRKRG